MIRSASEIRNELNKIASELGIPEREKENSGGSIEGSLKRRVQAVINDMDKQVECKNAIQYIGYPHPFQVSPKLKAEQKDYNEALIDLYCRVIENPNNGNILSGCIDIAAIVMAKALTKEEMEKFSEFLPVTQKYVDFTLNEILSGPILLPAQFAPGVGPKSFPHNEYGNGIHIEVETFDDIVKATAIIKCRLDNKAKVAILDEETEGQEVFFPGIHTEEFKWRGYEQYSSTMPFAKRALSAMKEYGLEYAFYNVPEDLMKRAIKGIEGKDEVYAPDMEVAISVVHGCEQCKERNPNFNPAIIYAPLGRITSHETGLPMKQVFMEARSIYEAMKKENAVKGPSL